MTEPIKLPPLPLEDALKRAYYYTEAGEWRYPETCNEWDRWHAVAKVATLAVEQATADLRAELARVTESARTTIKQMRDEGMRAEAECDKLRAEVDALKRRLGQHDSCNGVMSESGYVPECAHLRAEVERLRAELARRTTLPPLWGKGCPVCGLGAGGTATGYVCQRGDCPTRVTCGVTK